jgi:nucleoside 2-deoxyribosyltransferase
MKTFKIYEAGGMGSLSWAEQSIWRDLVEDMLKSKEDCFKHRLDLINPTSFYNFIEKKHDSELEVMKYDLRHVESSNLILVNFNDPHSIGTSCELSLAYHLGIPIIGINQNDENEELHPWLICMVDKMFKDIESSVKYIIEFYLT